MTPKEFDLENLKFLQHYFTKQGSYVDDIVSTSCNAIMTQFLIHVGKEIRDIAYENDGKFTTQQLVNIQIKVLQNCIKDLYTHLTPKDTLQ